MRSSLSGAPDAAAEVPQRIDLHACVVERAIGINHVIGDSKAGGFWGLRRDPPSCLDFGQPTELDEAAYTLLRVGCDDDDAIEFAPTSIAVLVNEKRNVVD